MPDVVVVSDSAMDLSGGMYGLACMLREKKLNLLLLVSKPGAGAKELAAVWRKAAPRCVFGLTCYNLNDVTRRNPWAVTGDILSDISVLLKDAAEKCSKKHEVFVKKCRLLPRLASEALSKARVARL